MHKGGEDPDLTEVKAVLRKLQRLDEASIDKVEAKRAEYPVWWTPRRITRIILAFSTRNLPRLELGSLTAAKAPLGG